MVRAAGGRVGRERCGLSLSGMILLSELRFLKKERECGNAFGLLYSEQDSGEDRHL